MGNPAAGVYLVHGILRGLCDLRRQGLLCDVTIKTQDACTVLAHRVCLAAGSGYFRALFLGAGMTMRSTSSISLDATDGYAQALAVPMHVVHLPEASSEELEQVLASLYEAEVQITANNLQRLLALSSFLEVPGLTSACAQFMRDQLCLGNAVPLLILASQYSLADLKAELLSYICSKFSSLMCLHSASPTTLPENNKGDSASSSYDQHMPTYRQQVSTSLPGSGSWIERWGRRQDHSMHSMDTSTLHGSSGRAAGSSLSAGEGSTSNHNNTQGSGSNLPMRLSQPLPGHSIGQSPQDQHIDLAAAWHSMHVGSPSISQHTQHEQSLLTRGLRQVLSAGGHGTSSDTTQHYQQPSTAHGLNSDHAHDSEPGAEQSQAYGREASLCALPKDLMLELLNADELHVDSELDVLQLVVDWVAEEPEHRMYDLPQLLTAVRTEHVPLPLPASLGIASPAHGNVLAAIQQLMSRATRTSAVLGRKLHDLPAVQDSDHMECMDEGTPCPSNRSSVSCYMDAMSHGSAFEHGQHSHSTAQHELHNLPTQMERTNDESYNNSNLHVSHLSTIHHEGIAQSVGSAFAGPRTSGAAASTSRRNHGRPRRTAPTGLIAAGGHDTTWRSLKVVEAYDPVADTWTPGPFMQHSVSFATGALLDRELYVVGGTPLWSCVSKLSKGGNAWQSCLNPAQPRAHAGLVSCAGSLFLLGGRSQVQTVQQILSSMEIYNPQDGTWTAGPQMGVSRSALCGVALRGGVYAVGGQTGKLTLRTTEYFDLGSETWSTLTANLNHERKYASATVLGGRIYIAGGLDEVRSRLCDMEALDPREGKWQRLAPLSVPRSSAGMAALQVGSHGRLFVAGGSAQGDYVHESMEMYVPEKGTWTTCTSMGCGRSGLALCAM